MKLPRAGARAFARRLAGRRVPLAVTLALTYRCTQRCRYCRIWEAAGPEMSTEEVCGAIDALAGMGMCRLGLTGGEPLLRPDLAPIVDRARAHGVFTTVFSAGALVDQHLAALRRADAVLISLDGPPAVHDAARGTGAYDRATAAIRTLRGAGVRVWTNTVITADSLPHVRHVLDLAGELGFACAFQPVFVHSYSVDEAAVVALRPDRAAWEALVDDLIRARRTGGPVLSSERALRALRDGVRARPCLAGEAYAAVTPDGRVAPCQVLLQAPDLPDGRALGFAAAWARARKPAGCACACFATIEADLLFSLDPRALAGAVGALLGGR